MANTNARYYEINCAYERVSDSPRATAYLDELIEQTSPDAFSSFQYKEAKRLSALDEREGKTLP